MNDDLISREALKKAFEKVYPLYTNEIGIIVNKRIYDIIDNAPTVITDNKGYNQGFKDGKECTLVSIDVIEDITDCMISIISEMDWKKLLKETNKRPRGEWVDGDEEYSYYANCSCCGYQIDTHEIRGYYNFCPNCGADMRGGRE